MQPHVIETCTICRKNIRITVDPIYKSEGGVYCFMEHFRDWVQALNHTFPVAEKTKFNTLMAKFVDMPSRRVCNVGAYPVNESGCTENFETIKKYPGTLWIGADNLQDAWKGYVVWDCSPDCDIKAMRIYFNVSMDWDVGAFYARPIANDLEASMIEANELAGKDFQGFQFIGNVYVRLRTQEIMYTAAFVGSAISGIVAFIVLAISTMNIIVAAYAMLNIMFIVICCIGFMVMAGWQLGTIEGMCITICIGFSVDFVVHIAIAYVESDIALQRYERTTKALAEMGISVMGAFFTTAISSFIMVFSPMIPFSKFGIFILFDISAATFFAIGLFPAMLSTFGPEGDSGNIRPILCHSRCPWKRMLSKK